jgi:hypothetical protein
MEMISWAQITFLGIGIARAGDDGHAACIHGRARPRWEQAMIARHLLPTRIKPRANSRGGFAKFEGSGPLASASDAGASAGSVSGLGCRVISCPLCSGPLCLRYQHWLWLWWNHPKEPSLRSRRVAEHVTDEMRMDIHQARLCRHVWIDLFLKAYEALEDGGSHGDRRGTPRAGPE